jgi:hypothetical protein
MNKLKKILQNSKFSKSKLLANSQIKKKLNIKKFQNTVKKLIEEKSLHSISEQPLSQNQ